MTSYTDAKGSTTSYAYDSRRNVLSITYANGAQQRAVYNPLGEITQVLNARGHAVGLTYTNQGRIETTTFADGSSYRFAYDARGNLTSATDAAGQVTTFVYGNPANPDLLTEVDYPDGTFLKFTHDAVGRRTQSVDQAGFTVNYTYDAVGRLEKLTDAADNLVVQYTYDAAGRLVQKDLGNGTRTLYAYDAADQVLSITNYAPDHATVNSFNHYTYDAVGNPLADASRDGTWTYTYDVTGQLTRAVFASADPAVLPDQDLQYVYDALGNRISQTVNGVTTTYAVNGLSQYTSSITGGQITSYHYDADGNLVATADAAGTTRYTFNDLNQLTAATGPGLSAAYAYDPLGNRVSQTVGGVTATYQIDPAGLGNIVAAFDGTGSLLAHYVHGGGLIAQTDAAGAAFYYDFNALGSTTGITNAAGQYVNRYAYLPFGQTTTLTGAVANPFTYIGRWGVTNDGGPLLSMRARWYDRITGRFVSPDPLGLAAGDTNLRRYVSNAPTRFADATGLSPQFRDLENLRRRNEALRQAWDAYMQAAMDHAFAKTGADWGDLLGGAGLGAFYDFGRGSISALAAQLSGDAALATASAGLGPGIAGGLSVSYAWNYLKNLMEYFNKHPRPMLPDEAPWNQPPAEVITPPLTPPTRRRRRRRRK